MSSVTDILMTLNWGSLQERRHVSRLVFLFKILNTTKVKETVIRDLLFADYEFSSACDNYGLAISTKKTEMMYQPAPGNHAIPRTECHSEVTVQRLQKMSIFSTLAAHSLTSC